jgi:hypothetical protein
MDGRAEDAEVIDLATRRPLRTPVPERPAARSAVLVLPAEGDIRIVLIGTVGASTAAALASLLDAALADGAPVTVDLAKARIDDPIALAGALRRRGAGLRLVGRTRGLPPSAA